MRGGASAEAATARAWVEAVVIGVAVFAWAAALRRYGLDLVDEGTLLAQFAEVARGAVPYRDFQSGYPPLGFYWNAAVLRWLGDDLVAVRTVLAAVHGTSAALLYAIARRAGGPGPAATAVAVLWGTLRPVAPGAFATFNVPYPGWWAEAFGYAAVLVALGSPRPGRLALVGGLWGLTFLAKQNAGVFGLAGTAIYLALRDAPEPRNGTSPIGAALAVGLLGGFAALGAQSPMTAWELVVLGAPVGVLAVAVVRAGPATGCYLSRALALGAGFLVVAGPVLAALVVAAGGEAVLRDALQVGSGAAAGFRRPYPSPAALVVEAWRGEPGAFVLLRRLVDASWLLALPSIGLAGTLRAARRPCRLSNSQAALATVGPMLYLQLFPRADEWHVLPAAGLLLALALSQVGASGRPARRWVLAGLLLLAAGRSVPTMPAALAALGPVPDDAPVVPHASIRWDLLEPAYLRHVPDVAGALAGSRSMFGFPALAFFNFVTDTSPPLRYHYFFPGYPPPEERAAVLAALKRASPDTAIVLDAPVAFFPESLAAHREIVTWLEGSAWRLETIGPYRVARRASP